MKPNINFIYAAGMLFNGLGGFCKYVLNLPDFVALFFFGAGCGLILFSIFANSDFIKTATENKKKFFAKFSH